MAKKKAAKAAKAPKAKKTKASKAKKAQSSNADSGAGCPPMPKFKNVAKKPISTGKGATPAEIGASLVALFNQGKAEEVERLWHDKKIESIEGDGTVFLGKKGIAEKNKWWFETFDMHSGLAEGPYVGASGFAVRFTMEVSPRGGGERMKSSEVGVYTVSKGKIVREEFMGMCQG
jgi:hypothetical protein